MSLRFLIHRTKFKNSDFSEYCEPYRRFLLVNSRRVKSGGVHRNRPTFGAIVDEDDDDDEESREVYVFAAAIEKTRK